jgi:hypothetical protein
LNIKKNEKLKRGLYSSGALLLCVVLLLSLWFTNKNNNRLVPETTSSTEAEVTTDEIEVNIPVTNIPDEREDEVTNPQITKVYFDFPLKNKIIKAYSNGEIVKNITTDDWRTHNALDIEGKPTRLKALCPCILGFGEKVPDIGEKPRIGCGI